MKNGSDSATSTSPRKLKFVPKIPVRKHPKPAIVKIQSSVSKDDTFDKELLAKLNSAKSKDDFGRRFKIDKKASPAQVTFGCGNTSTQVRSFGTLKQEIRNEGGSDLPQSKEYIEPWDYIRSHYPVTLPLRRPYLGSPEILDRLEFEEGSSAHLPTNENSIDAAHELGFMETSQEPKMIFLQFPTRLPLKLSNEEKGHGSRTGNALCVEGKGHGSKTGNVCGTNRACKLKDLPAGFMGKLLVYRSGKVKMKLGDVLFDVSPGADHIFAEEVVAVNAKEKQYCVLGDLSKHAVITPDVDSLLDDFNVHNNIASSAVC